MERRWTRLGFILRTVIEEQRAPEDGDRYKSGEVRISPIASTPLVGAMPAAAPEGSPVSASRCQVHGVAGRPSRDALPRFVTVSQLAALLLAQVFYGVSDREAERRSRVGLSWKAALALPVDHRGIPHVCLVEFRARLVKAGMEGFLQERMLTVAKRAGVIGHRRVADSTGIADSVITQDTITLIRSAARRCLDRYHVIDEAAASLRGRLARSDYHVEGKPQILWSYAQARAELVAELFGDAMIIIEVCAPVEDAELAAHVELLRIVAGQDIEIVDDDNEAGDPAGPRIRHGVAVERVISTVDTDARHGHRSRSDRYDGYKIHMTACPDSDLITAVVATSATTHDGSILTVLLDADPVAVQEVIADTHYGSGPLRQKLADRGIEIVAPAPPASAPKGMFSKTDFTIALTKATIVCPNGQTAVIAVRPAGMRIQVRFDTTACTVCPSARNARNALVAGSWKSAHTKSYSPPRGQSGGRQSSWAATGNEPKPNAKSRRSKPDRNTSPGVAL